jgi:NhaP-type Na+/H+ or K+/H+ antiporter
MATKLIKSERWGHAVEDQTGDITLVGFNALRLLLVDNADILQGMTRIVIGVQLVIAGYQLPAKYLWQRWKDMALVLVPVMTIMWLCTTGCVKVSSG